MFFYCHIPELLLFKFLSLNFVVNVFLIIASNVWLLYHTPTALSSILTQDVFFLLFYNMCTVLHLQTLS